VGRTQWLGFPRHYTLQKISPVIVTCGVSVLQGLQRTKAVLGGL
jgi:hypothetical protein